MIQEVTDMAKCDVWMPLYIGDYLSNTSRLTTEQHGAYLLLIMDYWVNGRLPDDDAALANVTKLTLDRWLSIRPAVIKYFTVQGGELVQERIEIEKEKAEYLSKVRSDAGSKGGSKTQAKHQANAKANGKHGLTPSQSPSPSQLQEPLQVQKNLNGQNKFDLFWSVYPKKVKKKGTLTIWQRRKLDDHADKIIEDVKTRIEKHDAWKDKQYIPDPSTYLNGERWNDEIIGAPAQKKKIVIPDRNDHKGIDKLGQQLGIYPKGTEDYYAYRQRLIEAQNEAA